MPFTGRKDGLEISGTENNAVRLLFHGKLQQVLIKIDKNFFII